MFANRRTKTAAWFLLTALPALLVLYSWFDKHRPPVNVAGQRTAYDLLVMNLDLILGVFFLVISFLPFFLVFGKKPQARDLVPIAVMAALGVVGRTVFAIIPLPNFKPVSAIVIMTGMVFGPETGFLTGALTGFVSNFIFGQGPWTPWQMFAWGMIGFLAGALEYTGFFKKKNKRDYFTAPLWGRLCPEGTARGDLLGFARSITNHASMRLCLFGLVTGFLYGWFLNLYFLFGYVDPITWPAVAAAYVSSFFFDLSHGVCTFLVLWALADPWTRKLNRVKVKFGLVGEERHYEMPPETQHRNKAVAGMAKTDGV